MFLKRRDTERVALKSFQQQLKAVLLPFNFKSVELWTTEDNCKQKSKLSFRTVRMLTDLKL